MFGGNPERLFDLCSLGLVEGFLSDETVREVKEKLCDPNGKFRLTPEQWTIINIAIQNSFKIVPAIKLPAVPTLRDILDLHIVGAAAQISADAIVTGDKDLLALGKYQGISVVTVSEFLQQWSIT